jgi:hypothetical protein
MIVAGATTWMDPLAADDPDVSFHATFARFMVLSSRSTHLLAQATQLLALEDRAGARLLLVELKRVNRDVEVARKALVQHLIRPVDRRLEARRSGDPRGRRSPS